MKSKTLRRRVNYYKRNKQHEMLKQLGTTTMSVNPNISEPLFYLGCKIPFSEFVKEQELIQKESKRNNGVTTVYKGKNSYAKGRMKFTHINPKIENYQIGIQITHNYANFNDYSSQFTKTVFKQKTRKCPDCNQTETNKDRQHAEIQCSNCGLVLMGPYDLRIKYPFMEYPTLPEEPENMDPMSWYPKPESHKKERGFDTISFDTTPVKVICSKCKRSDTVPFNVKGDGCPVCGGHYMGAGICMPHDYDDEFATGKGNIEISYDMRATEERKIGE